MRIGKWKITTKDYAWFIFCLILMLCFFIGLFIYNKDSATAVLSGASTAVSVVLSVVAILYTMLEGANSSKINQDTINKLENIDIKLQDISEKTKILKDFDKELKHIAGQTVETIEKSSKNGVVIDDEVKKSLSKLRIYLSEDIDE